MNKENKLIPGLPSGFEDRWDKKLLLKKKLLKAIENNFIKFGAEALETPSFEISENIGSFLAEDDANPMSDVFSFQDGEKSITLRYDLSSPLARFVAQNNQELPSIFKRYAIQNVFRNEKAGNGRYREFMQADFDIVGNVNPAQANAELCNLISSTLLDCGLKKDQFTINISNRKIVQGLIDYLKISEEKQVKVIRAIDKLDKPGFGLKGVEDLLKKERKDISGAITKGADLNDEQASEILNFLKIKDLKELKETLKNPLSQEGIQELEQVFEVLGYSSNLNQVKTNFTIVRGLAYYSDFIVETNLNFKVTNNKGKEVDIGSICSGGAYAKLISRFKGVDIPGTGISFGVDRLLFALMQLDQIKADSQKPVLVCVMDEKYLKNYLRTVNNSLAVIITSDYLDIDNNIDDCIIVYLGDLRTIPYEEQLYWKSFNINPKQGISKRKFQIDFLSEYVEPEIEDLKFKNEYININNEWNNTFGFKLFTDFDSDDIHCFKSLRIPLKNDKSEFDNLILNLAKVVIDYINIKEINNHISTESKSLNSIEKLKIYLENLSNKEQPEIISFFKDLHKLRSVGSAHRKSSDYNKILKKMSIQNKSEIESFKYILNRAILTINLLRNIIKK